MQTQNQTSHKARGRSHLGTHVLTNSCQGLKTVLPGRGNNGSLSGIPTAARGISPRGVRAALGAPRVREG